MKQKTITLRPKDFTGLLERDLSSFVKKKINEYKFVYSDTTSGERDSVIKKIVTTLLDPFLVYSGKHRLIQWEKGWGQNLGEFVGGKRGAVIPHYFGKYPVVRINQKWIKPVSNNFEYNMLGIILDWLFDKYAKTAEAVYEFGCGTGHNLFRLREINNEAKLYGLDWATSSQKLIQKYAREKKDERLFAEKFDFFKPNKKFKLDNNAIIYTIAALEQVGNKHGAFINYLLAQKPKLCIHVEPIAELLDENNLLDYFSIEYFKKRKYLNGFLSSLREFEKAGKIKIERTQRTYIGSFFIEGYSVVVWKPI